MSDRTWALCSPGVTDGAPYRYQLVHQGQLEFFEPICTTQVNTLTGKFKPAANTFANLP